VPDDNFIFDDLGDVKLKSFKLHRIPFAAMFSQSQSSPEKPKQMGIPELRCAAVIPVVDVR